MIIIRSQHKTVLGKYIEIKIDGCMILGFNQFGSYTILGDYETREAAKKVLDSIHSRIKKSTSRDYMDGNFRVNQEYVFEMPAR